MVERKNTLIRFLESQDYKEEFKDLMIRLSNKYGKEIIDLCGIGKQLSMSEVSKQFFKSQTTADASIDGNANVADKSVISHNIELAKPFHLINSYYRLWKELKKNKSREYADYIIESQISGRLYINDFHGISSSRGYSYYKKTTLVVKYRGEIIYTNMEQLFEQFKDRVEVLPDRETIDLTNVNIQVLDDNNEFVKLTRVLRHKSHCDLVKLETKNGYTTIVTEDHPVILEDGSEKFGKDIVIGDKLKISNSKFTFFKGSEEIDKMAYILGFVVGDGYIVTPYQFSITQKDLQDHKVYQYICEKFGKKHIKQKHDRWNIQTTDFGNKCTICKYNSILKGAENKKLPKDILNWDENQILSLVAGLIDSDGCVNSQTGVIDIRITSFTCIQQIAELLRWLGFERVRTSLIDKNGNSGFRGKHDLYRVSFVCNNELLAKYSCKINEQRDVVFRERQKDGRFETNEVMKILPYKEDFVYDITTATGQFHSQGLIQHNCFNYSTYDIALLGISDEFDGRNGSVPPKNLMSFLGQIELFALIAGNSTLGATGLADLLIVASIFVDKILQTGEDSHVKYTEEECWKYVESLLCGLIYRLNQPYRGSQSLFTNISIYDSNFIDNMLEGDAYQLEIDDVLYKAKKENIQKLQDIYLNIMNREMERKPLTFPVTTATFSVDEDNNILDKEFLDYIAEKNMKFGFINIYSGKSSTLSSCCFDGEQKVLTKSSTGVKLAPIKEILEGPSADYRRGLTVFHNGSWVHASPVILPAEGHKMYKVVTQNNKEFKVTDNHLFLTQRGDVQTSDLVAGTDYLAFNTRCLDTYPEADRKLTYEQGVLIGAYLGDGSKRKHTNCEGYATTFSLSAPKMHLVEKFQKALNEWGIDREIHMHDSKNNVIFVNIYGKELFDIINEYVDGNYALEKGINPIVYTQSREFRKGVLDGLYYTDGGNSCRIYSSSDRLIGDIEALCTTLGLNTIINVDGRGNCVIHGVEYNRNAPVQCIKWYNLKNKRGMGEGVKVINNTEYFLIKSIEEYEYTEDKVYCFEIKDKTEPYFTLPNGCMVHNCRLRSERDNEYFNSFGSGSTKIGSLSVATGNLPQLAFKTRDKEKFLEELKQLVIDCQTINNAKRNIVNRTIKTGAQPLYSLGYMSLRKQYSTFGVIGLYEALEILGMDIQTKEGQEFALKMLGIINNTNEELQKKFKYPHNCEQIPGENVAVKLSKKDRILGYNDKYNLYSNQFVPLVKRVNMLDRIELQGLFDKHFSGGAICHINMDQEITDKEVMKNLIETCAKQGVVYFAINFVLQECENHHLTVGNVDTCPICGSPITGKYTRVVGFLTKVEHWIDVRREQDFPNRQFYGEISV